jgi:hypothetical protein
MDLMTTISSFLLIAAILFGTVYGVTMALLALLESFQD